MRTIQSGADLRAAIIELEIRQAQEAVSLKEEFQEAYESIKPINLIKNTFKEVGQSQDLTDHLISTGVGLAVGYLSKVAFQRQSHGALRRMFGRALQFGITSYLASHPEIIKSIGRGLMEVIDKLTNTDEDDEETQSGYEYEYEGENFP